MGKPHWTPSIKVHITCCLPLNHNTAATSSHSFSAGCWSSPSQALHHPGGICSYTQICCWQSPSFPSWSASWRPVAPSLCVLPAGSLATPVSSSPSARALLPLPLPPCSAHFWAVANRTAKHFLFSHLQKVIQTKCVISKLPPLVWCFLP